MQIVRRLAWDQQKEIRPRDLSESIKRNDSSYGVAVDVGTTTITMALYDIENKRMIASVSEKNEQTSLGSDVMMRLMHCQNGKAVKLHELLLTQLERMMGKLSEEIHPAIPQKSVFVGNTTMMHLFLNRDTSGLRGAPFRSAYTGTVQLTGEELGWKLFPKLEIVVLPGIASHVGADMTACLLDQGFAHREPSQTVLLVDIGTNAEMALLHQGRITVCSAPAGPAFEGMEISQGMSAGPGAICDLRFANQTQNLLLSVLEGASPKGICGSGLVSIVAALRRAGCILPDGYLLDASEARQRQIPEYICKRLSQEGFVVYDSCEDALASDAGKVTLTQEDIRQYQLAKASIQSGLNVLLWKEGVTMDDVDSCLIAGVFGNHLPKKDAIETGLLPPENIPCDPIGNAAGAGAVRVLLDAEKLLTAQKLADESVHLELAQTEEFQRSFLTAMELTPWPMK